MHACSASLWTCGTALTCNDPVPYPSFFNAQGMWAEVLGFGDFYYELGVQVGVVGGGAGGGGWVAGGEVGIVGWRGGQQDGWVGGGGEG